MRRENKLKQKLREGKTVFGPFMKLSNPAVIEIFAHAGFDFAIIDLEHGPLSVESAENLVRAAELAGITPIIRVTDNEPTKILRALDIGVHGVQVPQVSSRESAELAVKAAKYDPQGERGVCRYVRAADYSAFDKFKYFPAANENTLVLVHIEGLEGVEHLEEILDVPGIDVIFIGPYDLSQSLGLPGQVDHPDVVAKAKEVIEKAAAKKVAVGTFVDTVEAGHKWQELGVQYISYAVDVGILYEASKEIVSKLRKG
ncbi:MAG: HpcH/HpaI aldolase family protein [Dethiobacteria bacterium]|jgi:4-hydroxy-2-oxoheptanedioate aldolase|nr:aldolase [Bacillota bacterium]